MTKTDSLLTANKVNYSPIEINIEKQEYFDKIKIVQIWIELSLQE